MDAVLRRFIPVAHRDTQGTAYLVVLLFASCLVTSSAFPLLGPTPALPQFHPEWQLDRLDSGRSIGLTRYQEPPKWMNPCGGVVVDADSSSPSDTKIAAYAILDVQLALNYVHQFKDRFVRTVYRMDFDQAVRMWAHVQYDWLPSRAVVPKHIGERVSTAHLNSLKLGPTLKKLFLASQTLAVGMEQVILDRAIYGGDFLEEFAIMENRLGMVLCSLQMALMEKQVQPDVDAARQMMSKEYRDMKSESGRNLRDFIILRDYINLLEYLSQVLQHFQGSS